MGILAMQRLHRLINDEPEVAVKSIVYGRLVVRASCGASPAPVSRTQGQEQGSPQAATSPQYAP